MSGGDEGLDLILNLLQSVIERERLAGLGEIPVAELPPDLVISEPPAPPAPVPVEPPPAAVAFEAAPPPPAAGGDLLDMAVKEDSPPETLEEIRNDLGECKRCKLCSGRANIVFGEGSPKAGIVFVGEAPGAEEDRQGRPFVGRAGQLLTRMIEAMGLTRQDVYICNILKCRPPGNRDPEPDEVAACEPFLKRQLRAIRPRVIVALGRVSAQTLLRDKTPITKMRGQWRSYEGIEFMPTYHPAYLLRNPKEKRPVWEDLQEVMRRLYGEEWRPPSASDNAG